MRGVDREDQPGTVVGHLPDERQFAVQVRVHRALDRMIELQQIADFKIRQPGRRQASVLDANLEIELH